MDGRFGIKIERVPNSNEFAQLIIVCNIDETASISSIYVEIYAK